jgi:hypothetical protein
MKREMHIMTQDTHPMRPADLANRQGAEWNCNTSAYGPNSPGLLCYAYAARMAGMLNACRPEPEPAGHRVTLTRPRFLRAPLVIRTNANPSHAAALADLRAMFQTTTGRTYLPRRGDLITTEFK